MNRLPIIFAIIAIIAAVAASVLFFNTDNTLKETTRSLAIAENSLLSTQSELTEETEKANKLEAELSKLSASAASMKQEISTLNAQVLAASQEVRKTKSKVSDLTSEITKIENSERRLKQQLITLEEAEGSEAGVIAQLNERVEELESSNSNLKAELEKQSEELALKMSTINTTNSQQRSRGISISSGPGYSFSPNSIGPAVTIASIRSGDGVMTISNPEEAGIQIGQSYTLVKDLTAIAKIQITEIKGGLAVTHILPGSNNKALREGLTASLMYQ